MPYQLNVRNFVCMDGRKNNKGKRKGDKVKIPITIYKPADEVAIVGGVEAARITLRDWFDKVVDSKR